MGHVFSVTKGFKKSCWLAICLLVGWSAYGQRVYDTGYLARNLGLEGLVKEESQAELLRLPPRLDSIEAARGLDSTQYPWLCLQVFRVLSMVHSQGPEAAANAAQQCLLTPPAQQNTFATRALLTLEGNFRHPLGKAGLGPRGSKVILRGMELSREAGDIQMEFDLCVLMASVYIRYRGRDQSWEWLNRAKGLLPKIYDPLNCHLYYVQAADAANTLEYNEYSQIIWPTPQREAQVMQWIDQSIECGEEAFKQGHYLATDVGLAFHIRSSYWRKPDEELYYYERALPYARRRSLIALAEGHAEMGRILIKLGKLDSAKVYLDSAAVVIPQNPDDHINLRRLYFNVARYYESLGTNQDSVFKYQMLYYKSRAEGTEARAIAEIAQSQFRYQEAQQELTIMEQQGELDSRLSRNRVLTVFLVGLGVLLALTLFTVLRIRQRNRLIQMKNNQIEAMLADLKLNLKEKTVLVKEVNHRVKNNLQMITAFLDIQAQHIEKEETHEFAEGIRKRIRAVSLVHELIVDENRLATLEFAEYVDELSRELEGLYYKGATLEIILNIVPMYFDQSTNMYLGILLNELISNSLKYADPESAPLRIEISLELEDDLIVLTYFDSGPGVPEAVFSKTHKTDSIGLMLVETMARQLEGKLIYDWEQGGRYVLKFPFPEVEPGR